MAAMKAPLIKVVAWLLCAVPALSDSWEPPTSKTFSSPRGEHLVRITPAIWNDKRAVEPCRALIFQFIAESKEYRLVHELLLVNPVRPIEALISDDGSYLVTFDDYYSVGYGENVIVVYDLKDGSTTPIRLEAFLSTAQIDEFDHSTSSLQWRGSVDFMADQRTVYIGWAESVFDETKLFPSFKLDLQKKFVSIDKRTWDERKAAQVRKSAAPVVTPWWMFWR